MARQLNIGDEVQNVLTGERFTYKGKQARLGDVVVLLESEGHTHKVDIAQFKGFFSAY